MLHSNATLYRGLTCFKKLLRHYSILKSWSAKIPPGGGTLSDHWPITAWDSKVQWIQKI